MIDERFILLNISVRTQREAVERLVQHASSFGRVLNEQEVVQAVLHREAEGTTGFGKGFAIPHGKSAAVKEPTLLYGRLVQGVNWVAMDGEQVNKLFMILVPESNHQEHLHILAKLARLLMHDEFIEGLELCGDVKSVAAFLHSQLQ